MKWARRIERWLHLPEEWRLRRELSRLDRFYGDLAKRAREDRDNEEEHNVHGEWQMERGLIEEELYALQSRRLTEQAGRLRLPYPRPTLTDDDKYWTKGDATRWVYLTNEGVHLVRNSIRAEKKARNELYLPWATVIIGIIGALTGLFAVILSP